MILKRGNTSETLPWIWLNTHFNHSKEMTPEAKKALTLLADVDIPLGNQTVLLRGAYNLHPATSLSM
jgi:L-lysine 2,3-aminomutase